MKQTELRVSFSCRCLLRLLYVFFWECGGCGDQAERSRGSCGGRGLQVVRAVAGLFIG